MVNFRDNLVSSKSKYASLFLDFECRDKSRVQVSWSLAEYLMPVIMMRVIPAPSTGTGGLRLAAAAAAAADQKNDAIITMAGWSATASAAVSAETSCHGHSDD